MEHIMSGLNVSQSDTSSSSDALEPTSASVAGTPVTASMSVTAENIKKQACARQEPQTQKSIQAQVELQSIASAARSASRLLRTASRARKDDLLIAIACELEAQTDQIVSANALDMQAGRERAMTLGLLDRLELTPERISAIAQSVRDVAALPDPVGEIVEGRTLDNGLRLKKVRVPMGVIGMIYEARPNVTVDAAVLALKAGSAAILRGGSAALHSNQALVDAIRAALASCDMPVELVSSADHLGRDGAVALMRARGLIDVLIPRGGAGLIQTVVRESLVPVIETGVGNVHIYLDAQADISKALPIVLNSKLQRVGVCNAAETLLVHRAIAADVLPALFAEFATAGAVVHGDEGSAGFAPPELSFLAATEEDWAEEYLAKEIAVKIVGSADEAIEHILRYSTGHTEAIVSENYSTIQRFSAAMDCAAIAVNASTRFTDGGQFGMGAEIGISTQKLHARGPMGLREITTTAWIIEGDGHVRS